MLLNALNEGITTGMGLNEIEVEMVIRGPPPSWCASVCPEYLRDPCPSCQMREVYSIDRGVLKPGGEVYFISKREIDKLLKKKEEET